MRRFLGILVGAAVLSLPIAVAAHHHLKHEFHVYDADTLDYIAGATVSVEYLAGSVTGLTGGGSEPSSRLQQGSVQFRLPGEYPWVHVTVTADGYCPYEEDIYLGGRPHVGGQGIWVAMEACQAASVGAAIAH